MGSFKYLKISEEDYRKATEFEKKVYKNIPLVAKIVGEAVNYSKLDQDDLFQIGLEALVEAVQKYDPSKKRALSTFVGVVVRNRVYYNIKTTTYDVKVAYGTVRKLKEAENITRNSNLEGNKEQSIELLVDKMNITKTTAEMLINLSSYSSTELTINDTNYLSYEKFNEKTDTTTIHNVLDFIIELLSLLPVEQSSILILRLGFYDGYTHSAKDVGIFLNKSEEYVRSKESTAIIHLRDHDFLKARYKERMTSNPWQFINNRIELNNSRIDK